MPLNLYGIRNTVHGIRDTKRGLTLIELMVTVVMVAILMGVMVYIFHAILLSWSGGETRAGMNIGLDSGIEEMVQDLREARSVNPASAETRFTKDNSTFYIYYLYNSGDTYPQSFNQSSYQLKKATLSGGGINGNFTYGDGDIIISDVLPPPTSSLSYSAGIVNIDLSITRKGETIRRRTQVRPRNMLLTGMCCEALEGHSCIVTCPTGTKISEVRYVKYGSWACKN